MSVMLNKQQKYCQRCGEKYLGNGTSKYCLDCKEIRVYENSRAHELKSKKGRI